jgi:hypothetical protein
MRGPRPKLGCYSTRKKKKLFDEGKFINVYKQVTALLYGGDIVCMPLCIKVSGITRQCQNSKGKYCGAKKKQYDIKITSVFPSTTFSRSYNTLTTAR